ncbi:unnamed protein product [Cuscuta campestris]|uniref:Uncharacterized protein n=1 Tax=Cuscuta campestris TaxID=132261 RepID=A0A484MXT1_9ASTE|nr:unnamed protein product [Cuscuta campestris]
MDSKFGCDLWRVIGDKKIAMISDRHAGIINAYRDVPELRTGRIKKRVTKIEVPKPPDKTAYTAVQGPVPSLFPILESSSNLPHSPTHLAPLGAVNPVFVKVSLFGSVCQAAENEGDSICVNLPLRAGLSNNVSQGDKDIVLAKTQFVEGTVTEAIDKPESVESRGNSDISSCPLVNEGAYIDSLKGREAVAGNQNSPIHLPTSTQHGPYYVP